MITNIQTDTFANTFQKYIESAIKSELDLIYDNAVKEMTEKMDSRKAEVISAITIKMMKMVELQTFNNRLRIEVLTDKLNIK